MANRILTSSERQIAGIVVDDIRERLHQLSSNNADLEWALRRYVYIRLQNDERGTSMERRSLKAKLVMRQHADCAICRKPLPEKGAVLDRLEAMKGYTEDNTRLLCPSCDKTVQEQRNYA